MGSEIKHTQFSEADFRSFRKALLNETHALSLAFDQKIFQCKHPVGGFELEAWIVDDEAKPVPYNQKLLKLLNNVEVVPELSQFNFEINVEPEHLKGKALALFQRRLLNNWSQCCEAALTLGGSAMAIGIHPSIREFQLNLGNMSKSKRYQALNEQILRLRSNQPLEIKVKGNETLDITHSDVMIEAATTSFQIHLMVNQDNAVLAHTASQIISAALLGISANSPFAFGVDLWDESRIPIFEQSVDTGEKGAKRVTFGSAYAKKSLLELFEDNVYDYPVLIPENRFEDNSRFQHVRLHNGTIWRWNRPLIGFNSDDSLHLRIENRVVPSGPTIVDIIANAAFYWGFVEAFVHEPELYKNVLDFEYAKQNFYSAAKHSLNAKLMWQDGQTRLCKDLVLELLLPFAHQGLRHLGLDIEDINYFLNIIQKRCEKNQNGALWQRKWVEKNGRDMDGLSQAYLKNQHAQIPVHEWTV